MAYVLLTILLSAAFNLMMKHAHARNYGMLAVGCVNYIVAGLVAVAWALPQLAGPLSAGAVLFGCLGGTMYVLCYLFLMVMLDRQGISIGTAMTRLAIAVPILFSIVVWQERPTGVQVWGLVLTFAALSLFDLRNGATAAGGFWHTAWPLTGCFLTAGCSRLSQKAFAELCVESERPLYLAAWFGFAGLIALAMLVARRERPRPAGLWFGVALGIVNILSLFCIITALQRVPAMVFFPVTSVASLVVVVGLAAWWWKEWLDVRTRWGLVVACGALVLVNLK